MNKRNVYVCVMRFSNVTRKIKLKCKSKLYECKSKELTDIRHKQDIRSGVYEVTLYCVCCLVAMLLTLPTD